MPLSADMYFLSGTDITTFEDVVGEPSVQEISFLDPPKPVGCYVPRRYINAVLIFLGLTACYLLRSEYLSQIAFTDQT